MIETRNLPALELRVEGDDNSPKITGYAAVYNSLSHDLGGFRERIAPGAFDKAIGGDVMGRYNHELILGRTTAGTMRLFPDEKGLRYEITPANTAITRHVVESIKRGDVSGSSFAFRAIDDSWSKEDGAVVRELRNVELFDVGPVDQPAYPGTNGTVSMRALERAKELNAPPVLDPAPPAEPPAEWVTRPLL